MARKVLLNNPTYVFLAATHRFKLLPRRVLYGRELQGVALAARGLLRFPARDGPGAGKAVHAV